MVEALGNQGFRCSQSPSLPLTKIWGRDALQGGGAEDCPRRRRTPKKGRFPPPHPLPLTDPTHTSAKKNLQCFCSFFCFLVLWVFFFVFFCFPGFFPESADCAQLEAWLSCCLWSPGQPLSLGPLTSNPGSSSEPELDLKVEGSGLRDSDIRSLSCSMKEMKRQEAGVLGS